MGNFNKESIDKAILDIQNMGKEIISHSEQISEFIRSVSKQNGLVISALERMKTVMVQKDTLSMLDEFFEYFLHYFKEDSRILLDYKNYIDFQFICDEILNKARPKIMSNTNKELEGFIKTFIPLTLLLKANLTQSESINALDNPSSIAKTYGMMLNYLSRPEIERIQPFQGFEYLYSHLADLIRVFDLLIPLAEKIQLFNNLVFDFTIQTIT